MDGSITFDLMREVFKKYNATTFYQTHSWNNKNLNIGIMGNEKNNFILVDDIKGKNILDLGCATGDTCIWAIENGAKKAIGLDKEQNQLTIFNELAACIKGRHKPEGIFCDISQGLPPFVFKENFNTIFCFAITQYIGYRKIWMEIPTAKVVYVMGGTDSNHTENSLSDDKYTAKFITFLPNNNTDRLLLRKLFRLVRNE